MDDRYDFRAIEAKWQERWAEWKTFRAREDSPRPPFYALEMFPYPSGAGLSVGHCKNYAPADAYCRFKSMQGFNVLHPMGWDAFGQPAENEAIKRGRNPREMVSEYAAAYKRTLVRLGASYDWDREINSSLPAYYRWTQWFFLLLYRRGLAFRATAPINWCPSCKTGLANEEVKDGHCWRCDSLVEKRPMPQWYFRITAYAERLLADLDAIRWPEGIKQMQREWIGRSEGAEVDFQVQGAGDTIRVFTTRPDTLWGATFMVLAPEHPLVERITSPEQRAEVEEYARRARSESDIERMSTERAKTGVFTGTSAVNPVNGAAIPIWIADYVLMGYGTGAIMAVPAHDQRDFEFAHRYALPIELVYVAPGGPRTAAELTEALPEGGAMRAFLPGPDARVDGFPFAGRPNSRDTVRDVTAWLEAQCVGEGRVNYRIRDWLISRQRYWGAPIPIVHCPACGEVPVPEEQLPVLLPEVERYQPSGTGESPLAAIAEFVSTTCPRCGGPARRETDTMGGFACSSWYFVRFADPHNDREFASRERNDRWLPVDLYTGGAEHAVMHLLYARFWTKVMSDAGLVGFVEPFETLRNQGSMLAWTPGRRPRANERAANEEDEERVLDWIVLKPEEREGYPAEQVVWRWTRMSKSKGNVVTPDDIADRFGADSLRVYVMFVAPFEDNVQWSEDGINGAHRFVNRLWRWLAAALPVYDPGWRKRVDAAPGGGRTRQVRRKLHQTIRRVGQDVETFQFNTAIAALMELVNELYLYRAADGPRDDAGADSIVLSEAVESLVLLAAPFAPHLADEMWERLGKEGSTYHAAWPQADPDVAAEDEITLVVQVNGKLRDRLTVPAGTDKEGLEQAALASARVREALEGKQVRDVIVVPGRLVNVVIG
ncbi:MAG: leucine--tRNA ligase [Chthonomonadales bacterium]|nr:leucine--tRNA ligase [Chthonomonadales bacterium]